MPSLLSRIRPRREVHLPEIVTANPTHIWIEPTNRCNTRCTHCEHYYRQFGEDMPLSLYEKVRDQVLDGVERAELIGYGEPFMAKHYWEMFDECQKRGIRVFSTSNGILMRDDTRVSKVVRADMVLTLSIDGARKETLEFVRPYIKWHKMEETLECLKRNADAAGAEKRFMLRFNFVAMKQNFGDLPDLIRLAHKYGAFEICVLPLGYEELFDKVNGQALQDSPELVSPVLMQAIPLAQELGVTLTLPPSFQSLIFEGEERAQGIRGRARYVSRIVELGSKYVQKRGISRAVEKLKELGPPPDVPVAKVGGSYCMMPWKDAYFASSGTVYPCCMMSEELGNLNKQEWPEIWNGPAYRNLRRTTHSWNPSGVCRKCPLILGINGGDGKIYDKFFSKFERESIPLGDPMLRLGAGFHPIESHEGKPHHAWMGKEGHLEVDLSGPAKFLRIRILSRTPVPQLNLGTCSIPGAEDEPFDNSCTEIHFPIEHVRARKVDVALRMEFAHRVGEDPRDLALAVTGVDVLR